MSFAARKHAFRSGDRRFSAVFEPEPRYKSRESLRFFDNDVPLTSAPARPRDLLMGEKVRRVEQALAIMREGGGVLAQQVTSGAPSGQPRTFTDEAEFRRWFPVWMDKDEHIVVKGLKPNLRRQFW